MPFSPTRRILLCASYSTSKNTDVINAIDCHHSDIHILYRYHTLFCHTIQVLIVSIDYKITDDWKYPFENDSYLIQIFLPFMQIYNIFVNYLVGEPTNGVLDDVFHKFFLPCDR